MNLLAVTSAQFSATSQVHPPTAFLNKARSSDQDVLASQYASPEPLLLSKPIPCPPSSMEFLIQDSAYEQDVEHYDALTWTMYYRIVNARMTSKKASRVYKKTREVERCDRDQEKTEDADCQYSQVGNVRCHHYDVERSSYVSKQEETFHLEM